MNLIEAKNLANNNDGVQIRPMNEDGSLCPYVFSVKNGVLIDHKDRVEDEIHWVGHDWIISPIYSMIRPAVYWTKDIGEFIFDHELRSHKRYDEFVRFMDGRTYTSIEGEVVYYFTDWIRFVDRGGAQ